MAGRNAHDYEYKKSQIKNFHAVRKLIDPVRKSAAGGAGGGGVERATSCVSALWQVRPGGCPSAAGGGDGAALYSVLLTSWQVQAGIVLEGSIRVLL